MIGSAAETVLPPNGQLGAVKVDLPAEMAKVKEQLERYKIDIAVMDTDVPCVRVQLTNKMVTELHPVAVYIPVPVLLKTAGAILSIMDLPGVTR